MKLTSRAACALACALPLAAPIALPILSFTAVRPAWSQPLPERRSISGRITRADGAPVPKATVTIQRENDPEPVTFWGAETATDANGYFSFPDAEDGAYLISVVADNYAPLQSRPLRVSEGSAVFNLRLDRLASLGLRLLGDDGAPLKQTRAIVRLLPTGQGTPGTPPRAPRPQATNNQGILWVSGLTPGRYTMEVAAPGAGFASSREIEVQYAEKPTPIDVRLGQGGSLKVVARDANDATKALGGATLSLSATMEPSDEDRRAGRLGSRSTANLQSLYAWSSDGSGVVTREGEGSLELRDLPPGRYRAKLVLPAYAPSDTREVEVKAGESATLEFSLVPQAAAAPLKVRVLGKDKAPLADRNWTLQLRSQGPLASGVGSAPPLPEGEAVAEIAGLQFGTLSRRARSNANGEFTIFPLRAGRWRVLAFPTDAERAEPLAQANAVVSEEGGEVTLNFRSDVK